MPQAVAVPIIAAAIGAAGSAYSANRARQAQKPYIDAMIGLYKTQGDIAKSLAPYASGFYGRAAEAYDPAAAYYKAAAAGGPSLLAAAQPQLSTVDQKYGNIINTMAAMRPRSGGSLYDVAFRSGDEKQAILNNTRESAVASLAKMAGAAGDLGGGAAGYSSRASGTALAGVGGALGGARDIAQDRANALSQFNLTPDQMNGIATWANGKRDTQEPLPTTGTGTGWINSASLAPAAGSVSTAGNGKS